MFLYKTILVVLTDVHEGTHVAFIEGSQHGCRVLRVFKTLRDLHSHSGHLDTGFSASAVDFSGSLGFLVAGLGLFGSGGRWR